MRVIIAGSRECTDYTLLCEALEKAKEELGITIQTVLSGDCRGVDKMGEMYAKEKGLNIVRYPAKWEDIDAEGANVKSRFNKWTKKEEKYNSLAGFQRNELMAKNADALIAINLGTPGTEDMIKRAKAHNLKVYVYHPNVIEDDLEQVVF